MERLLICLLCLSLFPCCVNGEPILEEWYFGSEGLQTVDIIAQSRIPCVGRIGQYKFDISATTVVKSIVLPAGEFPLTISCTVGFFFYFGLRASIVINGDHDVWNGPDSEWTGYQFPDQVYDSTLDSSCSNKWTASMNADFTSAGGVSSDQTVWPCTRSTTAWLVRTIKVPNNSASARKVTIVTTADDFIPSGNFGAFSFDKGVKWQHLLSYSIYVEPGSYPFDALVVNTQGAHGFAAVIYVDDVIVTKTGDAGWLAMAESSGPRVPFSASFTCATQVQSSSGPVYTQFMAKTGVMPSWIWTSATGCASTTDLDSYARFRYQVDVRPLLAQGEYRKIDFQFSADNLFMMRLGNGPPIIGSDRDAVDYYSNFWNQVAIPFSLYLSPGTFQVKFSVANYEFTDKPANDFHIQGRISSGSSLIDVTNNDAGRWIAEGGNPVTTCNAANQTAWSGIISAVESPFANTGIQALGYGSCRGPPVVYNMIYTLILPATSSSHYRSSSLYFFSSAGPRFAVSSAVSASTYVSVGYTSLSPLQSSTRATSSAFSSMIYTATSAEYSSSSLTSPETSVPLAIIWQQSIISKPILSYSFATAVTASPSKTPSSSLHHSTIAENPAMAIKTSSNTSMPSTTNGRALSHIKNSSRKPGSINRLPEQATSIVTKLKLASPILWVILVSLLACTLLLCVKLFRQRPHHKSRRAESEYHKSTTTDSTLSSFSKSITGSFTASSTTVHTTGLNVLAIPAYLQVEIATDFRIDEKLNTVGASEIMLGTAFAPHLSAYGPQVVVKLWKTIFPIYDAKNFHQEISITAYFQTCRNIVRMLGYCQSPPALIMKFYPHGSVRKWMKNNPKQRNKNIVLSFLRDISTGLQAMHTSGLIHCDIKSDNVLVDIDEKSGSPFCVLCDFGITQVVERDILKVQAFVVHNRQGYSLMYAAPEVIRAYKTESKSRHYSSDVYAYGIIITEFFNGGKLEI